MKVCLKEGSSVCSCLCFLYLAGYKGIIYMLVAAVLNGVLMACQEGSLEFPADDCFSATVLFSFRTNK